jgi:Asp/Glu/hydantoin racemase
MSKRVVFVHTVPPLIEVFRTLSATLLPGIQIYHILDEPLLERVRHQGYIDPKDIQRLATHASEAAAIGADAMLVTCSTVSPGVDEVRALASIPVLKIDEAMIAAAVQIGGRIGVVATNVTTLAPTRQLLLQEATRTAAAIDVTTLLVKDALPALLRGEGELHDRLVADSILSLANTVDVIVLAQASMARVLDSLKQGELAVPVLASPQLALAQVAQVINGV